MVDSCANFCTKAECAELQARISALESALELLQASFNAHTSQEIPEAHNYDSNLRIGGSYFNEILTITVADQTSSDSENIPIPLPEIPDPPDLSDYLKKSDLSVQVDVFEQDNNAVIKVLVSGESGEDTLIFPEIPKSNVGISGSYFDEVLTLTITDGETFDTEQITIPSSNLNLSGSCNDGTLELSVSDGQSNDTASIKLCFSDISSIPIETSKSNVGISGSYYDEILTLTITDGETFDTAQIPIYLPDMNCDYLEQLIEDITPKIKRIYNILGGDNWQYTNDLSSLSIQPEDLIKTVGESLYTNNENTEINSITVNNILELLVAYFAVNFHRNGHHRLPATVLNSLINNNDGNQPLVIEDTLSFSEWIVRQIDAVVGEFPLPIQYKNGDNEATITIENLSEGIAELLGLSLGIASNNDTLINIGMKTLIEARNAANAAIVATDYAAANAEYLGYKGNEVARTVPLTFTPGATSLSESLKPSEKQIIGWQNEDKETLVELIKKTLIGAEIIKASLFHPWQPGQPITGDKIKEDIENKAQQNDDKWEQFKQRINNPTGQYAVNKPRAEIRDLTIDTPENEL